MNTCNERTIGPRHDFLHSVLVRHVCDLPKQHDTQHQCSCGYSWKEHT